MSDRQFIDALIDATMPRIQDLVGSTYERAANEAKILDLLGSSLGKEPTNEALSRPDPKLLRSLWSAALSDVAVSLLWGLAERARDGLCRCTPQAVEDVVAHVDRPELARETGVAVDDLRFVLREMGMALIGLVAERPTEVTIDRRSFVLRAR